MQAPRDMRDWMRMMERKLAATAKLPGNVRETLIRVLEEQKARLDLRPTFPVELTWDTAFYIAPLKGERRSRVVIDFPDVTKATTGADLVIKGYELWGKDDTEGILAGTSSAVPGAALPGVTLPGLVSTPGNQAIENEEKPWALVTASTQSFFRVENFQPGSWWRFRIRALGASTIEPGEWSAEIVVQMAPDFTPPPQPTAPVVTSDRGVLTVNWDGQSVLGAMPADFRYAVLAHGTASSPEHEVARFNRGGGSFVMAAPYNTPQFFRIAAVDDSGNQGPWSEQAMEMTTPLVDTDVILSKIDLAKTELQNFDVDAIIGVGGIKATNITVTEELTGNIAQFLEVKAGMLDVNDIWADTAWLGQADAKLVRSDMFEGKEFHGGKFFGGSFETNIEENTGIKWRPEGISAYNNGGQPTFGVDANTGRVSVYGRVGTGPAGTSGAFLLPAEDSDTGSTTGVFITHNGLLTGQVTAGMYVENSNSSAAQKLFLRGMNGGDVDIQSKNLFIQKPGGRVGNFTTWAIGDADNYLPNLEVLTSLTLTNAPTTSAPANAVIAVSPAGAFYRSTSSLRYKTDIQGWDPGYRVLGMETQSWVDRTPMDPADPLQRYYGLIAEQVAEVMPELATLNEFGEPESVQYERVGPALIPVIRDMVRRIEELEAR